MNYLENKLSVQVSLEPIDVPDKFEPSKLDCISDITRGPRGLIKVSLGLYLPPGDHGFDRSNLI